MRFIADLRNKWKGSIHLRHTVGLSVIIVVIMGIASGLMLYEQGKTIRSAAEARGLAFSRTFALMGATAVLNNLYLIQETIGQYLQDPDILQIDVIDPANMIVTAKDVTRIGTVLGAEDWLAPVQSQTEFVTSGSDTNGQPILVIVEPLFDQGQIAAWVRVIMSLTPARREEFQTIGRLLLITVALDCRWYARGALCTTTDLAHLPKRGRTTQGRIGHPWRYHHGGQRSGRANSGSSHDTS